MNNQAYLNTSELGSMAFNAPIKVNSTRMPVEYLDNQEIAAAGHGGTDYAMFESFVKAIKANSPSPLSLREGLRMTLPGIYAAQSAQNGGALTKIIYPWTSEG